MNSGHMTFPRVNVPRVAGWGASLVLMLAVLLTGCSKPADQSTSAPAGTDNTAPASNTDNTAPASSMGGASSGGRMADKSEAARKAPAERRTVTVPDGTTLTVRLGETISTKTAQPGQAFTATVAQPVDVEGKTAIPAGATVAGTVVETKGRGRFAGAGYLSVTLQSVTVGSKTYNLQTSTVERSMKGKGKRTAAMIGGGGAGGALIGGLAGGGKGAAIGALIGAGAGTAGSGLTGNQQVEIPAESALSFKLTAPVTITLGKGE